MTNNPAIPIPFSKIKLGKLLIISVCFIAIGLWMLVDKPEVSNAIFNNPVVRTAGGALSALMGLLGIYFFTRKISDPQPGLLIDESGITDRVNAFAPPGPIAWQDIASVEETIVRVSIFSKQKFVSLILKDPEAYIARQTKAYKRSTLKFNLKKYGAVVFFSANSLKIKHDELLQLLRDKLKSYQAVAAS